MSLPSSIQEAGEAVRKAILRNQTGVTISRELLEVLIEGHMLLETVLDGGFRKLAELEAQEAVDAGE